jgi:hypothetical protein
MTTPTNPFGSLFELALAAANVAVGRRRARASLASQAATLVRWVETVSAPRDANLLRHLTFDALHGAGADAKAGGNLVHALVALR